jgi:hypothetical protein
MDLQDVNSDNHQNLCTVPIMGDDGNFMQDKMCSPTASEAKAGVDLLSNGRIDNASGLIVGNDPNFGNTNIPLRTTVHGIFNFLVLKSFMEIYVSFHHFSILLMPVFTGHTIC